MVISLEVSLINHIKHNTINAFIFCYTLQNLPHMINKAYLIESENNLKLDLMSLITSRLIKLVTIAFSKAYF